MAPRDQHEFLRFERQVVGGEGFVSDRQVIVAGHNQQERGGTHPPNVRPRFVFHEHLDGA
jgi:hypothetical protein